MNLSKLTIILMDTLKVVGSLDVLRGHNQADIRFVIMTSTLRVEKVGVAGV